MNYEGLGFLEYPKFWKTGDLGKALLKRGDLERSTIRIPVASNYDLDNDYDYIMAKALKSYKLHRDQERAESRKGQLRNHYIKRHFPRPKTAPPARFAATAWVPRAKPQRPGSSRSVFMPKIDAITEVQKANTTEDEEESSGKRRVLQLATVNLAMMAEENKKAKSFLKRNKPAHPWYSNSYPKVSHMQKFYKPVSHSLMTASIGEPSRSTVVQSARSSVHSPRKERKESRSRPQTAVKSPNYNYDGGVFTHAKKGGLEHFVIHPDWVSESMSIQKLSLTERERTYHQAAAGTSSAHAARSHSWPGRRCTSAPPPKLRNPITWADQS